MTARRPDIAEPEPGRVGPAWTSCGSLAETATAEAPTERMSAERDTMTAERDTERVDRIGTEITEQAVISPANPVGPNAVGQRTVFVEPVIAEQRSATEDLGGSSGLTTARTGVLGANGSRSAHLNGHAPDGDPHGDADDSAATDPAGQSDSAKLVRLHESIASLLAARGEFRQAYHHMRSALDLVYTGAPEQLPIPEQFRREVDRLRREHAEAREQSIRDSLTASYNRRYLDQRLTALLAADTGSAGGLGVALVDLDWFKQVNDRFGHLLGDRVLQRVVELLSDGLPEAGFCARYGGEEFVLVLPGLEMPAALAVAEAARAKVECYLWSQLAPGLRVTVSVGLAYEPAGPPPARRAPTSAEQQLLRADSLLYAAKQSGRNAVAYRHAGRVVLAGSAANRPWVAEPRAAG
ncbi:MAG TPA: GGDEF domain-containing protein [Pseudonocardiaceae bacterium]|nr:GGDEF domain-containing protein [Pseudonocardiaceae bacterium]